MKKILYVLFTTAILAVILINIKIGNTYPDLDLLSFNLDALSSESSPGESSGKKPKCLRDHQTVVSPLNQYPCSYGYYFSNHSLTTHTFSCLTGANTSNGCQTGIIKIGHDCSQQYKEPWELFTEMENLSYASGCPKQQ
jgi:hypothetical protein